MDETTTETAKPSLKERALDRVRSTKSFVSRNKMKLVIGAAATTAAVLVARGVLSETEDDVDAEETEDASEEA